MTGQFLWFVESRFGIPVLAFVVAGVSVYLGSK